MTFEVSGSCFPTSVKAALIFFELPGAAAAAAAGDAATADDDEEEEEVVGVGADLSFLVFSSSFFFLELVAAAGEGAGGL